MDTSEDYTWSLSTILDEPLIRELQLSVSSENTRKLMYSRSRLQLVIRTPLSIASCEVETRLLCLRPVFSSNGALP